MIEDEEIIVFELWDSAGKMVAHYGDVGSLTHLFQQKFGENFREGDFRNIYRKTNRGSIRLVVKSNNPLFQGTKGVTRVCSLYLSLIPQFIQIENRHRQHFDSIIKRFAHNLVKFQIRFKGNFDRLISDKARSRPFLEFQDEVKQRIEANTLTAAQDICQMSHRAVDLDAQIDTLRIISGYADASMPKQRIRVDLRKTIFRLTNPFIEELLKRGVVINISIPVISTGGEKVLLDPALFNAAIWQLLDNASKYTLNNTSIEIMASLNTVPQKLEFLMTSVCIDEDEEDLIFLEGKKGRHSKNKGENGIGLFIVRKSLGLTGAKVYVKNEGFVSTCDGFNYCKHRFTIEFNK